MPAYSSAQRQAIAKFVNFTDVKDSVAAKSLKAHNWNVEAAVDAYFANPHDSASSGTITSLNKIFDSYREAPKDNPDSIGIDGAMKYLGDIQVQLDEVVCLAIAEQLKCPSMGEFTRENFINGWKNLNCDSIQKQIAHTANLRSRIPNEPDLFRQVYRYTFAICRLANQRNLTLEIAVEQWRLFFTASNGGVTWNTPNTPWLDWWIEFMETSFKRPVNKDLWEQTEVLMRKTREDETMSWWSPDGAWPGAIDDFVDFVKEKRGKNGTEAMDVE